MVSQMEMEAASEDITMVSFRGPLGCLQLGCWRSGTDKAMCCKGEPWDMLGMWWKGDEEDNREAGKVGLQAAGGQAGPRGLVSPLPSPGLGKSHGMLGLWILKGGWVPSMLILLAYTFHRLGMFSECLGVVEAIRRGNSKYGSWVRCLDHPQGLSPPFPHHPPRLKAILRGSSFVYPRMIGSPSTTTPHFGLLLSPSTLP
jgi:hypothetical protein